MLKTMSPGRIKGMATSASMAVVGTVVLSNFVRIFSSAVLTRLLSASDYGVIGIITSITYIVVMLSDFGFFSFIVRHADADDPKFLDQVWTIRITRSFFVTLALLALAWPYALYTGKPVLAPAIAIWSFNRFIDGCSSLAFAQAVRHGMVSRLSWMEFFANIAQVFITIGFALLLHNYWAIVIAVLVSAAMKSTLSYIIFPNTRRRLDFNAARRKEMWTFSRFIAGSSILTLLLGQSDKVVLSRVLPLSLFGIYSIATLLALAPRAVVYPFCNRILYPAYSKHFREHGLERFADTYYGRRRLISLAYMFILGGIIGGAPLLVAVLYDPRYAGVGPLTRIISISAALLLNNVAAEQAMIAIGRPRASFQINVVRVIWLAAAGGAGLYLLGPMGIIWAVGTLEVAALAYTWFLLAGIKVLRLREELPPLACAAAGVGLGLAIGDALLAMGWF